MNKNKKLPFIVYLTIIIFIFILITPFFLTKSPITTNISFNCISPNINNFFGTDQIGRDIFSRVLYGARTTIIVGISSSILAVLIGTLLGLLSGYFGGKTDLFINQLIDISLAFPSLLLAIGISIILPPGKTSIIIAITISGWASFARLIRSHVLVLKNSEYIEAAIALGSNSFKILFKHILPNCLFLIIISTSLKLGSFMLAESGLSFLGLGIPPPNPTLGGMISNGRDYLFSAPWIPLIPGIIIGLIVLLCNFMGEKLQDYYNPKI